LFWELITERNQGAPSWCARVMENFWRLLKRGLHGTYVSVEPFHLFRYIDEQAFRNSIYMVAVCRCFPGKNSSGGDRVPNDSLRACATVPVDGNRGRHAGRFLRMGRWTRGNRSLEILIGCGRTLAEKFCIRR